MDLVPLKNTLQKHSLINTVKNDTISVIQAIPKFDQLKLDLEMTSYVCNLIENAVLGKTKLDKKALVVEILTDVFGLTDDETHLLDNQIQYLFDNDKIKKISMLKYIGKTLLSWFVKKVV